jgi:hypothetical protein
MFILRAVTKGRCSPHPPRRLSVAELLQGSSQVVDVMADLLQFGPELRLDDAAWPIKPGAYLSTTICG